MGQPKYYTELYRTNFAKLAHSVRRHLTILNPSPPPTTPATISSPSSTKTCLSNVLSPFLALLNSMYAFSTTRKVLHFHLLLISVPNQRLPPLNNIHHTLPSTGKYLNPWPLPPVATMRFFVPDTWSMTRWLSNESLYQHRRDLMIGIFCSTSSGRLWMNNVLTTRGAVGGIAVTFASGVQRMTGVLRIFAVWLSCWIGVPDSSQLGQLQRLESDVLHQVNADFECHYKT
ncbi:hypothetical protein BKA64DRAFT_41869 [Cadophora sp. MPI-SDFR-AT-0126]|nr:hypothetical protein BKA64DRAFT_41869 [Leotiomycetes sp. MPI-SDFR-AT-0126]